VSNVAFSAERDVPKRIVSSSDQPRAGLAVRVPRGKIFRRSAAARSDAPHRGAHQERQAAEGGISGKRDPGGQGQRNRRPDYHHSDCCGQEYEPGKHIMQLPREEHSQDALRAWQDCGRVLVKIRLRIERIPMFFAELVAGSSPGRTGTVRPQIFNLTVKTLPL
jgi:hypothetical protein